MESPRMRKSTTRQAEFIMARRRNSHQSNRVEYLVHWQGYGHEDDTWEPCIMLADYKHMIKDFIRKQREDNGSQVSSEDLLDDITLPDSVVSHSGKKKGKKSLESDVDTQKDNVQNSKESVVAPDSKKIRKKRLSMDSQTPRESKTEKAETSGIKGDSPTSELKPVKVVKRRSSLPKSSPTSESLDSPAGKEMEGKKKKVIRKSNSLGSSPFSRQSTVNKLVKRRSLKSTGGTPVTATPNTKSPKMVKNRRTSKDKVQKQLSLGNKTGIEASPPGKNKDRHTKDIVSEECAIHSGLSSPQVSSPVLDTGNKLESVTLTPESSNGETSETSVPSISQPSVFYQKATPKLKQVKSRGLKRARTLSPTGVSRVKGRSKKASSIDIDNVADVGSEKKKAPRRVRSLTADSGRKLGKPLTGTEKVVQRKKKDKNDTSCDQKESQIVTCEETVEKSNVNQGDKPRNKKRSVGAQIKTDLNLQPDKESNKSVKASHTEMKRKRNMKDTNSKRMKLNTGETIKKKILKKAISRRLRRDTESADQTAGENNKRIVQILGRRRRRLGNKKTVVEYFVRWENDSSPESWEQHNTPELITVTARMLIKKFTIQLKNKFEDYNPGEGKPFFLYEEDAAKAAQAITSPVETTAVEKAVVTKRKYVRKLMVTTPFKDSPPSFKNKLSKKLLNSPVVDIKPVLSKKVVKKGKRKRNQTGGSMEVVNKALAIVSKSETSSISSSDEDVLYSLPENIETSQDQSKKGKKPLRKKLKLDIASAANSQQSKTSTPDTDPEISFKGSPNKRLLLKDSIRPKSQEDDIKSIACQSYSTSSLDNSTPYKTPPSSPGKDNATPSTAATALNYMAELPVPVLPTSPTAASYKNLMKNLQNLQADRGGKKKTEGEEPVERRVSVRSSESAFKYKEIVVKKCPGYTQIWLCSQTKAKNALNPKVFQELQQVLHNAKFDDSRLVLLSGSGNIFCSGIDLHFLMTGDRQRQAKIMAEAIRDFVAALINFPKPIMVAVNGPAVGLGAAILPLCDIVYASDKASFYCPYARLNQTPEGASTYTFPDVLGMAMANEMLLSGRKLTAIEANQCGLVSQVFWPTSLMQEVIPRLQNMAQTSAKALEASKLLIRSHHKSKLLFTNESESQVLAERWASAECQKAMKTFTESEQDLYL